MIKLSNLNKKKVFFGFILLSLVFFTLFVPNKYSKEILLVILAVCTIISFIFFKKVKTFSTNNKKVFIQMMVFGVIYVILLYFIGIYSGFYKNPIVISLKVELKYVIISTIVIVLSEMIRRTMVSREDKISTILTTLSLVIVDLILYAQSYDVTRLNDFLSILGLVIFASIAENLLFNYICTRFGNKPIIIFRLITVLYAYIIPILPEMYPYFKALIRIIFPYLVFLFLESAYAPKKVIVNRFASSKNIILSLFVISLGVMLAMLISCKFYYGIISIGSGSMTGVINKGDAAVFVKYTNQPLRIGDIIVFRKNNVNVIHRIVDIEDVNNELRYTTKGDYNNTNDTGYSTHSDIVGIYKLKIKYIGYPSILLGDFFKSMNR